MATGTFLEKKKREREGGKDRKKTRCKGENMQDLKGNEPERDGGEKKKNLI